MRCLTSSSVLVAMSQFDWPITKKKKLKIMEVPQNRRFPGNMECLSLRPTYISEKGEDFGQNIWD
jgi:hypothetical protein